MDLLAQLAPILLIFVVFWLFIIRPQQKRQRERAGMLNAISSGDRVVTIGGLHGTVESVEEKTVVLRVSENHKMTFERSAINQIVKS
ncbi:preprotein translocase subunit YajC [Tumebacillus algifaecis]|uniref:Preprotein translocase subunit YajC n=1 Tax=Tumebacillus algifaecis TaxID=1214604 RepID=A0A223CZV6_9BACL|nr:preprotein translocase subunit YajC [Tumebacillus algifaecis]ASS74627.1 preprotein translocase subunit YajC [Tumebacillus algifaecis]